MTNARQNEVVTAKRLFSHVNCIAGNSHHQLHENILVNFVVPLGPRVERDGDYYRHGGGTQRRRAAQANILITPPSSSSPMPTAISSSVTIQKPPMQLMKRKHHSNLLRRMLYFQTLLAAILGLAVAMFSRPAHADFLVMDDHFDDGEITSNTTGLGAGFNVVTVNNNNFTPIETGSRVILAQGPNGGQRVSLASKDGALLNSGDGTRFFFGGLVFAHNLDNDGGPGTDRFILGVNGSSVAADPEGNPPTGFYIQFESDSIATGTGNGSWNGNTILFYESDANVRTILATWSFDTLNWDTVNAQPANFTPTLDITLDLSGDGWALAVTGDTRDGGQPITFSGTYADSGIVNELTTAYVLVYEQAEGPGITLSIDRITMSYLGAFLISSPQISTPGYPYNTNYVYAGDQVILSASVLATGTPTYQWQQEEPAFSGTFINLPSSNTTNYTLNTTGLGDFLPRQFRLVVTNDLADSATSSVVELTVAPATAPFVTQDIDPMAPSRYVEGEITFSATFDGNRPITYQWQKSPDASTWSNISDATNSSVTLTDLQLDDQAYYKLVASNSEPGSGETSASFLTILTTGQKYTWGPPVAFLALGAGPTLTNVSGNLAGAAMFGGSGPVTVSVSAGYPGIVFSRDGSVATVNGGAATGALGANTTGNANFNTVLNGFSFDSGPKTIALNNLVVGQQYAVQLFALDNRGAAEGARQANFQDPADAGNVSSTFYMSNNVYVVGTFYASNTTETIQENLLTGNAGNMNALVLRALGWNPPPYIAAQPQDQNGYTGSSATFNAVGAGALPVSYQWRSGPAGGPYTDLVAGAKYSGVTSPNLTINDLEAGDAAISYVVLVSNGNGSIASREATLDVNPAPNAAPALIGHWLSGAASLADTSGYTPAGTHDAYLVGANGYFTNDVPPGHSGFSFYLGGGTALAIGNTSISLDVDYTNTFDNGISSSFSVVFWIKPRPGNFECVISKRGENNEGFSLRRLNSEAVGFTLRGTAGDDDVANGTITGNDGQWHLYAATWDGVAGIRRIYVDGQLSLQVTGDTGQMGLPVSHVLALGARHMAGGTAGAPELDAQITGALYDVQFYNYALNPSQILQAGGLRPALNLQSVGANQLQLSWPIGTLLEATSVLGPWTPNYITSPYTITPTGPQKFFRVQTSP